MELGPTPKMRDHDITDEILMSCWCDLDELQRTWRGACERGQGSPGLRQAAEALEVPKAELEREYGQRFMRELRYKSGSRNRGR